MAWRSITSAAMPDSAHVMIRAAGPNLGQFMDLYFQNLLCGLTHVGYGPLELENPYGKHLRLRQCSFNFLSL